MLHNRTRCHVIHLLSPRLAFSLDGRGRGSQSKFLEKALELAALHVDQVYHRNTVLRTQTASNGIRLTRSSQSCPTALPLYVYGAHSSVLLQTR